MIYTKAMSVLFYEIKYYMTKAVQLGPFHNKVF